MLKTSTIPSVIIRGKAEDLTTSLYFTVSHPLYLPSAITYSNYSDALKVKTIHRKRYAKIF